jgi:hypothetical protein
MWWSFRKKKLREITQTEMDLEIAKHHNPYPQIIADMKQDSLDRELELETMRLRVVQIESVVSAAQRSGHISNSEYAKYLLSEDPLFMPKLKTRE